MELELRHWISETVIAEGKKLLRLTVSGVGDSKSKPNYLQGNAKEYDNAMRVHLSGTRAVQIIDFNGQQKAPFTNISVSDVSCQIRASLSESARKQFEKKYDRRLPHRTVGAIFEIGGCSLAFNLKIKGVPQVTLNINSLILKGGEGSSNLGIPAPIEDIEDVRDLIARMKTTLPQAAVARSRYKATSPIDSVAESPSEDEIGSPNRQLGTQAPVASDIYDGHEKTTKKPAPLARTSKAANLPGNKLLDLIGKNKKSNTSSSTLVGGIPETRRSISQSDNKRVAPIEGGAGESNERKYLRLTVSGKDPTRVPVNASESSSSGKPIVHSRQGVPGENPRVVSQNINECGSNIETHLVDPLRTIASRSKKELPGPTRAIEANSRPTNTSTFSPPQENPWGKLTRIPLKHVIIPKNQLAQLSTGASWVTSVTNIESLHRSSPSGPSDSFIPTTLNHVEGTTGQSNTTLAPTVEAGQGDTNEHSLNDDSPTGVDMSGLKKHHYENRFTARLSDNISRDTAFQSDPLTVLDAAGAEDDDVVSWAPTSRASSIDPSPENENETPTISALPPPYSNIHSPQSANHVPVPSSSVSSPNPKLDVDSNVRLSPMLHIKSDIGANFKGGNDPLANNVVHSSIPYSEDDMEQRLPYAIGDIIQSSDDIHLSRIPASALTLSPTRSEQSPVLQIERTPYSRSQKDQLSLPETRFLGSPVEPKKSIASPHSPAGSIILGTFNWDAGNDDDDELQRGNDRHRQDNDDIMEPDAGIDAERSELLLMPVLDHAPIPIDAGGEREELSGENRNMSEFNQDEVKIRQNSREKSTQHEESSVCVDTEKLSEASNPTGSIPQVYNIIPSLPCSTSPTTKKIARLYITRRERKKRMEESET
ncbi:hypothetical protein V493_03417 [Pseudogymnoascus sp. VKM F-4281 (FW-2241)]|nr:hypothetical protein V493_03417 [Pseudogymnoascus sp. VKM F-4281 (FW-2241)]